MLKKAVILGCLCVGSYVCFDAIAADDGVATGDFGADSTAERMRQKKFNEARLAKKRKQENMDKSLWQTHNNISSAIKQRQSPVYGKLAKYPNGQPTSVLGRGVTDHLNMADQLEKRVDEILPRLGDTRESTWLSCAMEVVKKLNILLQIGDEDSTFPLYRDVTTRLCDKIREMLDRLDVSSNSVNRL
jgi:hypothetical protein